MSNLVENINDALTTLVGTELSTGYSVLNYIHTIEKNFLNGSKNRYGVRPLNASSASGVTRVYTLDHSFQIIITSEYINSGVDDIAQREETFVLYDKMDEVFKAAYLTKVGLPNTILNIDNISIQEPEYLDAHNVVVLRADFNIKYRQAID